MTAFERKLKRPVFAETFSLPDRQDLDPRLVSDAALKLAKRLSVAETLSKVFAAPIFAAAAYMLWKSGTAAFG